MRRASGAAAATSRNMKAPSAVHAQFWPVRRGPQATLAHGGRADLHTHLPPRLQGQPGPPPHCLAAGSSPNRGRACSAVMCGLQQRWVSGSATFRGGRSRPREGTQAKAAACMRMQAALVQLQSSPACGQGLHWCEQADVGSCAMRVGCAVQASMLHGTTAGQ